MTGTPSPDSMAWRYSRRGVMTLDRPRVIGILNVTPDSFADGGQNLDAAAALAAAARMVGAGADMLDVGGESTRPGATRVEPAEQIRRIVPVIERIRAGTGELGAIPISVDTTRSDVARAALDAGADAINDVSAGTEDPLMFALAAERGCGLVLMHRLVPPGRDRYSDRYIHPPTYADVVRDVREFLRERAVSASSAGVERGSIVIDPGLGFGKSVDDNLALIRRTPELLELGLPVLSAASRKSFVGRVSLGRDSQPGERLAGSLACSVAHHAAGARLFRVHDVAEQVQALRAAAAVRR